MGFKKWLVAEHNKDLAKMLAEECGVEPMVALIAATRGYDDEMSLEQFVSDELYFSDPYDMADISLAAEILNKAIKEGKKIAVFGDYDCDGVTATAIMMDYLNSRGADCIFYIPDRFSEGYGMNETAVRSLAQRGTELIITVDNGIACFDEIKLAKALGMQVIVTDHHLPSKELPVADAVVDPHRMDCPSEFKSVCGAQVAFRLICVTEGKEPEELLPQYADLLTVAILADIMPLTLENRSIVKFGIEKLKTEPSKGLSALMSVAGIASDSIDASRIAFGICPRINAAGRMGSATRAVNLLIGNNIKDVFPIANEIDAENSARQQQEKQILKEAVEIIETNGLQYNRVIVVMGNGWHLGIVGIVAAKIAERYGRPTILLSSDGETAVGSGRSVEGFSLFSAIDYCRDLLLKFGGHDQAAGVTIKDGEVDAFRSKINEFASFFDLTAPAIKLDCKLNPSAISLELAQSLKVLEPFGTGNPQPIFGVFGATLTRITPIGGGKHLRLLFTKGSNAFQALLFGKTVETFCFSEGDLLDVAVSLEENIFKGNVSLTVLIKAIRKSGTDDNKLFDEIAAVGDYISGFETEVSPITPSREEVATVYKFIKERSVSEEAVVYNFINTLGYGKVTMSVKVMLELGLIVITDDGKLKAVLNSPKTNLTNSETYRNLIERSGKND